MLKYIAIVMADWKDRLGVLYSTDPNFKYTEAEKEEPALLPNEQQKLRVSLDKKNRSGKEVTLVTGFEGPEDVLKSLGTELKRKCGTGGSVKDNEIIIQGDKRDQIVRILIDLGYSKTLKKGG